MINSIALQEVLLRVRKQESGTVPEGFFRVRPGTSPAEGRRHERRVT